jgi:hypothetical protein
MSTPRDALHRERDALKARIAEIDDILEAYADLDRRTEAMIRAMAAEPAAQRTVTEQIQADVEAMTTANSPTAAPVFERALRDLLSAAAAPVRRKTLLEGLRRSGVVVGGKDELSTLGTRLYRLSWVVNIPSRGYWLADRDFPLAGYSAPKGDDDEGRDLI